MILVITKRDCNASMLIYDAIICYLTVLQSCTISHILATMCCNNLLSFFSIVCRINDVRSVRARQFPEDGGPMAHPIRPESYIAMVFSCVLY